jgi:hypothetical protein
MRDSKRDILTEELVKKDSREHGGIQEGKKRITKQTLKRKDLEITGIVRKWC